MLSVILAVWTLAVAATPPATQASTPNVASQETTVTATVDQIDRFSRTLTLRRDAGILQMVTVDRSEKLFDELKVGDRITARFVDSVVVQVRPEAKLANPTDTTASARAENDQILQQLKVVVTIDRIDPDGHYIVYHTADGLKATRVVSDPKLLQGIRAGDRVEVTLTRSRAISIERAQR